MLANTTSQYTAITPMAFTSFGAFLLFLRRRAQLRQRDLAIAIGYSEAQIGRLENDQRLPDVATVMAQFVPALGIEHEPALAERLVNLAHEARRASDSTIPEITRALPTLSEPDSHERTTPMRIDSELSQQSTPLLGREQEIARLANLLHTPDSRCVTLVGPGGVGKTRLAIEVATRNAARFADGVCAVALARVGSADLLAPTIARTLGLTAPASGDVVSQLHAHLRDKRMLLVLDNMEHLVDAADMLARLLIAAPQVYLLATSRERLQLRGEITLEVAGLLLPPAGAGADALAANPAVALFCSSAQRLHGQSTPAPNQLQAAARVCHLVEGLPLAIELAAGWAHLLSYDEIERELGQTLDFLQTGMRDLPLRHRSLRAAFAHSWDMLAPAEQHALRRLSVFRGSFSREAADAVLHGEYAAAERSSAATTLHLLGALTDKSLLKRGEDAGASRFVLHELVRQYAAEHLRALPADDRAAHTSHSHYYLGLLQAHGEALRGPAQVAALATLAIEADQVRAALQWAIAEGDLIALRGVLPTVITWFEWTYAVQEGIALFEQISARLQEIVPPAEHAAAHREALALALAYAGWFNFHATHAEQALGQLRAAHALAGAGDDALVLGDTLLFLGSVAAETGDTNTARPLLLACMRAYDTGGDPRRSARGAYRLGTLLHQHGEYVRALHLFALGVQHLRPTGDPRALALCLNQLGNTHALLGRHAEAQQCFQESLLHCAATRDQRSMAMALFHMGSVAQHRADHATAQYFLQESLQTFSELNERSAMAKVLALVGYSAVMEDQHAAARQALDAAWQIVRGSDMTTIALSLLVGRAALDLAGARVERAVEALTLVVYHAASEQSTRDRAAHTLHQAEARLTPYQFAAAQARGRTAPLADYLAR
ncbi:MAG: tetratricopeptide repeat protein [Roseiflexaceae bacterium]|nr:tetratricopeptide repeat protein [Roseiflexaceae bacterium]